MKQRNTSEKNIDEIISKSSFWCVNIRAWIHPVYFFDISHVNIRGTWQINFNVKFSCSKITFLNKKYCPHQM